MKQAQAKWRVLLQSNRTSVTRKSIGQSASPFARCAHERALRLDGRGAARCRPGLNPQFENARFKLRGDGRPVQGRLQTSADQRQHLPRMLREGCREAISVRAYGLVLQ